MRALQQAEAMLRCKVQGVGGPPVWGSFGGSNMRHWSAGPMCALPHEQLCSCACELSGAVIRPLSALHSKVRAPALPRVQEHELARRERRVLAQPGTRRLRTVASPPRNLSAPCRSSGSLLLIACLACLTLVPYGRHPRWVTGRRAQHARTLRQPELLVMRRLHCIAGRAFPSSVCGRRGCRRGRPGAGGVGRAEAGQAGQLRRQRGDVAFQLAGRQRASALLVEAAQVQALRKIPS